MPPKQSLDWGLMVKELPLAVVVVLIVAMMVIPMPYPILDFLITFNLTFSLLVLLVTMATARPLDFTAFPTLLLLTTLFRLSLNVSSARLILLQGFAGHVIQGFGQFVVGGNPVVGFIIFLILVIIQYVVITKGAERVAEVAARFTLDAMPGKQMAIDADLNTGLIDDKEALRRRREIEQEADFYGAMDGGSRFVRGDAMAGILITVVNIVGGFIIGMVQRHLSFSDALSTYTLLTVGDGLVSQIPALLLSTATGIVVTRAATQDGSLGENLAREVMANPRTLWITAGALPLFGLVPGLPFWSFGLLGLLFAFLARTVERSQQKPATPAGREGEKPKAPENVASLLPIDPLEVELGYGLLPLADPKQGGDLLDRVVMIRRQTALDIGLVLSPIRVRDNLQLKPDNYVIKLRGIRVAQGEIRLGQYLAMNPGTVADPMPGTQGKDPVFGLPALWVPEAERGRAETAGYTVVDPPSVIATHLSEVVREYGSELLGRQEVQNLLDGVKADRPAVVEDVVPTLLSVGELQKVLQNLLAEGISIRDMTLILEAMGDAARISRDLDLLTERARQALARTISQQYGLDQGKVPVVTVAPEVERRIMEALDREDNENKLALDPETIQALLRSLGQEAAKFALKGRDPILLASPLIRLYLRRLTRRQFPRITVLSYAELGPQVEVESVGMVSL